jgi:hypothetical protein
MPFLKLRATKYVYGKERVGVGGGRERVLGTSAQAAFSFGLNKPYKNSVSDLVKGRLFEER